MLTKTELIFYYNHLIDKAAASPDPTTKVGACVIDKNKKIKLTSYNNLPQNISPQEKRLERPEKYNWIICAERNLIYTAAQEGIALKGLTMIVTRLPCIECAKAIIQSGIKTVILIGNVNEQINKFPEIHRFVGSLFKEANVTFCAHEISNL